MATNVFARALVLALAVTPMAQADDATFTDLQDSVPNRCFSAALSTIGADAVTIGIESGFDLTSWISKTCTASTRSFYARTVGDTFTATVIAPPGMRIARIRYEQQGTRYLERSTYWTASGTGTLTVGGVAHPFGFSTPTLVQTVDLTDQAVASTTVTVGVQLVAKRNSAFPRVTDAPGSATIGVTSAVIRVEFTPSGCAGLRPPGRNAGA